MPAETAPPSQEVKRKAAREVIDILHDIATLLVTLSYSPNSTPTPMTDKELRTRISTASNSPIAYLSSRMVRIPKL
jgi:hypothetical protein